jgi:hypothetical protein
MLRDVKTATSLAMVHVEPMAELRAPSSLIPEFQGNPIAFGGTAIWVEYLATACIGARKNPVGSRHGANTSNQRIPGEQ